MKLLPFLSRNLASWMSRMFCSHYVPERKNLLFRNFSFAFFFNTKDLKMMIFHHTQLSSARKLFWGRKVLFKYLPSHINNHGIATNANIFCAVLLDFCINFLPFSTRKIANKVKKTIHETIPIQTFSILAKRKRKFSTQLFLPFSVKSFRLLSWWMKWWIVASFKKYCDFWVHISGWIVEIWEIVIS